MADEVELVHIECPICKAQTDVSIPYKIIGMKKLGTTQIKISKGICCEHNFIIFLSKKMKILGAESADIILDQEEHKKEIEEIYFADLVTLYGKEVVGHFLHAFLLDIPIIYTERIDFSVNVHALNTLFNNMVPTKYMKPFIVSALRKDEQNDLILNSAVLFDPMTMKLIFPWKESKKIRKFAEAFIDKVLTIMEPSNQAIIIQEELGLMLEKAEFIRDYIKNSKSHRKDILEAGFSKKYGEGWSKGEFEILAEISKKKFGAQIELLLESSFRGYN